MGPRTVPRLQGPDRLVTAVDVTLMVHSPYDTNHQGLIREDRNGRVNEYGVTLIAHKSYLVRELNPAGHSRPVQHQCAQRRPVAGELTRLKKVLCRADAPHVISSLSRAIRERIMSARLSSPASSPHTTANLRTVASGQWRRSPKIYKRYKPPCSRRAPAKSPVPRADLPARRY